MQKFKTAVNTVMADIQDTKSKKAFEELKKLETTYTERVLERIGLFDKNKNDIKLLIQRNIIKENDLKNMNFYFLNKELIKNNKDIKKLYKTLNLLTEILIKHIIVFKYKNYKKYVNLDNNIIKKAFNNLNEYIEKNEGTLITLNNLIILDKLVSTLINNFIYKLKITTNEDEDFEIADYIDISDYMKILKYIIIIIGINIKISNYIAIISIIEKKQTSKELIDNSLSSQSFGSYDYDIINKIINDESTIYLRNVNRHFRAINKKYKVLKIDLALLNKNNKQILLRIIRTIDLLYNLYLRNASIFISKQPNNINLTITKEILDKVFLPTKTLLNKIILSEKIEAKNLFEIEMIYSIFVNLIDPYMSIPNSIRYTDVVIGKFNKGYKDYKNYVRYISILKKFRDNIKIMANRPSYDEGDESNEDEEYYSNGDPISKTIITPKSSNRSYKSSYKKDNEMESFDFKNLSPEPLSAIKSSPKYSTYFAEK